MCNEIKIIQNFVQCIHPMLLNHSLCGKNCKTEYAWSYNLWLCKRMLNILLNPIYYFIYTFNYTRIVSDKKKGIAKPWRFFITGAWISIFSQTIICYEWKITNYMSSFFIGCTIPQLQSQCIFWCKSKAS